MRIHHYHNVHSQQTGICNTIMSTPLACNEFTPWRPYVTVICPTVSLTVYIQLPHVDTSSIIYLSSCYELYTHIKYLSQVCTDFCIDIDLRTYVSLTKLQFYDNTAYCKSFEVFHGLIGNHETFVVK